MLLLILVLSGAAGVLLSVTTSSTTLTGREERGRRALEVTLPVRVHWVGPLIGPWPLFPASDWLVPRPPQPPPHTEQLTSAPDQDAPEAPCVIGAPHVRDQARTIRKSNHK